MIEAVARTPDERRATACFFPLPQPHVLPISVTDQPQWLCYPFATSRTANEQALRELLCDGCEIFRDQWSTTRPFLIVDDVDQYGVLFACVTWDDPAPRFMFWHSFFRWLRANAPIDGLRLAPSTPKAAA